MVDAITRAFVRHQARYCCEVCGLREPRNVSFDCHHVEYWRFGHEDLEDLMLLCRVCHDNVHRTWPPGGDEMRRAGWRPEYARSAREQKPVLSYDPRRLRDSFDMLDRVVHDLRLHLRALGVIRRRNLARAALMLAPYVLERKIRDVHVHEAIYEVTDAAGVPRSEWLSAWRWVMPATHIRGTRG